MSLVAHLDVGRSDRVSLDRGGTLRDATMAPVDIVVDNLSRTGCLFVVDTDVPLGALVSLGIPGVGVRYARVTRVDRPQYACAFLAPVSDAEIVAALSVDTLVAGAFPQMPVPAAPEPFAFEEAPSTPKLPTATRMAIIAGTSLALWGGVVAVALLAIR